MHSTGRSDKNKLWKATPTKSCLAYNGRYSKNYGNLFNNISVFYPLTRARVSKSTIFREKCSLKCSSFYIQSFIHSRDLYSASSRYYYSEALQAQSRPKKKDFREI